MSTFVLGFWDRNRDVILEWVQPGNMFPVKLKRDAFIVFRGRIDLDHQLVVWPVDPALTRSSSNVAELLANLKLASGELRFPDVVDIGLVVLPRFDGCVVFGVERNECVHGWSLALAGATWEKAKDLDALSARCLGSIETDPFDVLPSAIELLGTVLGEIVEELGQHSGGHELKDLPSSAIMCNEHPHLTADFEVTRRLLHKASSAELRVKTAIEERGAADKAYRAAKKESKALSEEETRLKGELASVKHRLAKLQAAATAPGADHAPEPAPVIQRMATVRDQIATFF